VDDAENGAPAQLTRPLIAALALLSAFAPMSIDMYLPAFPTIQAEFGTDVSLVQLSLSVFMLGFGGGQVFYGPLGDHFGRRPVLLGGVLMYMFTSLACTLVSSPAQLIGLRLLQGISAGAPPVMARTMVRDLAGRDRGAQVMSILMASVSVAPMLAPVIGSQLMAWFGWRSIFVTLTLFGAVSLAIALAFARETLHPDMRGPLDFGGIMRRFGELLTARAFLGYALTIGFMFGAMFAYISLSSFVLIGIYGLTPTRYALVFGLTVLMLTIGASVNSRITRRLGADLVLRRAVIVPAIAGLALTVCGFVEARTGALGWMPFVALATCLIGVQSFIAPNAMACALQRYPHMAGTASSLLGVVQFGGGALFGAAAGALLAQTVLPMALFMGLGGMGSYAVYRLLVGNTVDD
jgi:DHA1 family bicyclomycin/chloramphenicol resistance-like MFS transporter